ncbi:MAG TPA: penicillin-binding protein 2, partial [Acidimicrobiales bacterium]|nr:penicillin-binding protein 2 [Acidimicrobiales bacterium]
LRMGVLGMVVLSLFAALYARLWFLQVVANQESTRAVIINQVRVVPEEAPRGRILDRQGRTIVDNRVSQAVTVNRVNFKNDVEEVTRLAALLKLPPAVLVNRINDQRFSPYKPVPVAEDVPEDVVVYLGEHRDEFPGVEAAQLTERSYPNGNLGAHLLGYVGEINGDELKARKGNDYRLGDTIGKSGVERSYEDALRGVPGLTKLEVDSRGHVLQTLDERPPEQGSDLQLTVDLDVQKLAEESLAQGIEAARRSPDKEAKKNFLAPAGAAVVLDPKDGSVLAMASFPTYTPGDFVNGIRPELFQALNEPASHFPLTNRAISGQYAPGSTFKLVTSIAGLTDGLIQPGTTVVDTGSLKVGNRVFKNAGSRSYGRVGLVQALTVSSDVYFYQMGANFWYRRGQVGDGIQQTARALGLGAKSGILLDGEQRGRVPDPESRKRLHDKHPDAFPEGKWFAGDNVNLAIGQGETLVTPLQLANAYATFANGGTVFMPRVAARVLKQDGAVVREVLPEEKGKVELPSRDAILSGLRGAVSHPDGTAYGSFTGFPGGFPVAGKTGTAQVQGKQDTALFAAFAPADNPQYVVAVVMEEAGFGGSVAAPVARRILEGLAGRPPGPVHLAGGVD